ncbi:hypothetical protein [Sinomicrobium sp. M5D2P17]
METKTLVTDSTNDMIDSNDLPVITIVELRPKVALEGEALDSIHGMIQAASQYKGYQVADVYKKVTDGTATEYAVILRFDSYSNLSLWNNSRERENLITSTKHLYAEVKPELALTGLDFWFVDKHTAAEPPAKWKMMLITVIIIFALLKVLMPFLGGLLEYLGLPEFLNTLLSIMAMVALMTYLLMPAINRVLHRWLFKNKR